MKLNIIKYLILKTIINKQCNVDYYINLIFLILLT